jgi:hypothetical protein
MNEGYRSNDFQRRGNNAQRSRSRSREKPQRNRMPPRNDWRTNSMVNDWSKKPETDVWNIGVDHKKMSNEWDSQDY